MHEVLVNRLGGLSLPRKSVVRLTDRPDMTLDVYRGRKTTIQPTNPATQVGRVHFQYIRVVWFDFIPLDWIPILGYYANSADPVQMQLNAALMYIEQ